MSTFLFLWFIFSFVLEPIVVAQAGEFKTAWKKVLYSVLIVPTILWSLIQTGIGKLSQFSWAAKLGTWLKS